MVAIVDFSLFCTSGILQSRPSVIGLPDLENMGIDVGISLLSRTKTELHITSFFQSPSWIFDFLFHPTVFLMVPLKSLPPKTEIDSRIVFLSRQIAELLGGGNFTTPAISVTKFSPLSEG